MAFLFQMNGVSSFMSIWKVPDSTIFVLVSWYKSSSTISTHIGGKWRGRLISLIMHRINLKQKTDPCENLILGGVCSFASNWSDAW